MPPTTRIARLTSDARLAYRQRDPAKYAWYRMRILACFESLKRELTRGEIRFYATNSLSLMDCDEILRDLVTEQVLLFRTVPQPRFFHGISHCYRRPGDPMGGTS